MKSIISFFMSIIFAIEAFFGSFFVKDSITVRKLESNTDFYCDGISSNGLLSYGVAGKTNLFAPDENIKVIIDCRDSSLYGTKAKVAVKSDETDFSQSGTFDFKTCSAQYYFIFSSSLNGIFDILLKTSDGKSYSFSVGIMPKNSIASSDFLYGIQPYITRAQCWGEDYRIPGLNEENSIDAILNTAEYMGVNLVREDGISWSGMQSYAYDNLDCSIQDYLVNKVTSRSMKYNWILGGGTTEWSISENYKSDYDASKVWSYAPDETMWEDYISKIADHYAGNSDILWEIWNEPNWEFFTGTQEEYFTLLKNTAEILKSKNSNAYVYSGGLAVAERDANIPYFKAAAELISKGIIDNWGYHNHDGIDIYCDNVNHMLRNSASAGLSGGGINSESGSWGVNASLIACKALYTRATGADGFVSFSFRKTVAESADVNDYAFFNEYLQPTEAVIAYSTVIRFLGNAEFISSKKIKDYSFTDEYKSENHTVYVYYSLGESTSVELPDNILSAYDMYGNPVNLGSTIIVNENPVYVIL